MEEDVKRSVFPETAVGGWSRVDSTVDFYLRTNALLRAQDRVLNFGAGRGRAFHDDPCAMRRGLQMLRGKVARVVGVDVDDALLSNPGLDEAHVIGLASDGSFQMPFGDAAFDLVLADWVFEHVSNPEVAVAELARVVRPGGWVCARTPNRWGYVALGARLVPNRVQSAILRRAQPEREAQDVFPKLYRLNTPAALRHAFGNDFEVCVYGVNPEPAYFGGSRALWAAVLFGQRFLPERFSTTLHIFMQRKGVAAAKDAATPVALAA